MPAESTLFITPEALLSHWQGHRRLTSRVIDAFPDDQLFSFSVGGMRPFGALAMEMITMAVPMVRGVVSGDWSTSGSRDPRPKQEVLRLWDEITEQLNSLWPQIPPQRFRETLTAFGQYTGVVHDLILYVIDNEIHHRGQATCTCVRYGLSRRHSTSAADVQRDACPDHAAPAMIGACG